MVYESRLCFSFDNRGLVLSSGAGCTLVKNWVCWSVRVMLCFSLVLCSDFIDFNMNHVMDILGSIMCNTS